ncbi:MAG: OsmC family peroxiredoxin [Thermoleophilia bacterium]|jgi:osmotically inducible protein OsmC
MISAERRAQVTWNGTLAEGSGRLRMASGAAPELPVTWASRTARSEGKTSPEELIAAAHASCFAMAFSGGLTEAGTPPRSLDVTAAVTFAQTDAGFRVASSRLEVRGVVPGLDQAAFETAAAAAKDGCPVSQALRGNVEISVAATLEQGS